MSHKSKKNKNAEKNPTKAVRESATCETLSGAEGADVNPVEKKPEDLASNEGAVEQGAPTQEEVPISEEDEELKEATTTGEEKADSETPIDLESPSVDTVEKEPEGSVSNEGAVEQEAPAQEEVPVSEEDEKLAALDDLLKAQEELAKTKEAYVRSVADFDNYRRRVNDERPKNMVFAKGDLAKDLFPVLDNFKLGLDAAEKAHPEAKSILEGFAMISSQIKNALAQHGIVEIAPKVGDKFDPLEHESISSLPSEEIPEDHILLVQRVGYKIGDRLLRPASVVLATKQ